MEKIHLIMPMGGGGTRFGNKGFEVPKPLIELKGKPFFYWAVRSVVKFIDVEDIVFVVLKDHVERFDIDKRIREFYPDARIKVIPQVLNGAVLTCLEGIKEIDDESPVLFNDCDHGFLCEDFYEFCRQERFAGIDAALMTFRSSSPAFSYVRFDDEGRVIGTVEKVVVSDEAICGAYYFANKSTFSNAVDSYLKKCRYKEFFISGVYDEIVKNNGKIITFPVDEHISFGTPDEYDQALNDERLGLLE